MNIDFVAEVSSNHHRDLDRCLAFIDKAAHIGCSAVKFQLFKVDELFAPAILQKSQEHRMRKSWELPVEFLPDLAERCHKVGIQFGCTPFYVHAVEELFDYVDFYKISSYELLWSDLLVECARTLKPIALSTGMATIDEIAGAFETLRTQGCEDLTLLHCVSSYPTPPEFCNLAAIKTLRTVFKCDVGWSDHSVQPGVIYRAVHQWSASMVEFHLDLDGYGDEYDAGYCWLPGPIQHVIRTIKTGIYADGCFDKSPAESELADRDWRADPSDGLRPLLTTRKAWYD